MKAKGNDRAAYALGKFDITPRVTLNDYEKSQVPRTLIPQKKLEIMEAIATGQDSVLQGLDHEELHDVDGTYNITDELFDIGDTPTSGEWKSVMGSLNFWIANTDPPIIVPEMKNNFDGISYLVPESFKNTAQAESAIISSAADAVYNIENNDSTTVPKDITSKPDVGASTFIDIGCDYTIPYIGVGIFSSIAAARGVTSLQCVLPPVAMRRMKIPLILASRLNLFRGHFSIYAARVLNTKKEQELKYQAGVDEIGGISFPTMHTAMVRFSTDERVTYNAWKSAARFYTGSNPASQVLLPIPAKLPAKEMEEIMETMNANKYKLHILPSGPIYDAIIKLPHVGATLRKKGHSHVNTEYISIPQNGIGELVEFLSKSKGSAVTTWWTQQHDKIVHEMLNKEAMNHKKQNEHPFAYPSSRALGAKESQ